ncbi:glycoside hydrolase family 78 protein [Sphaerobolus stellatus SS14]|uniref:Glycoside hydrolase family 78 protein n=1 Tax=Sphaerobolus stellatus (strain SS14) TaxID=990650 RepID=A0A0C9V5E5_SPHS4|nr:glycoside hydrolase family 78 protein [Sphaerobolus stellatus SS14]
MPRSFLILFFFIGFSFGVAPKGPWDGFNLAPSSKVVRPIAVKKTQGTVTSSSKLLGNETNSFATIEGESWITLDFGGEVGGIVSLTLGPNSPNASLSLAFTESPLFIGPISDDSVVPTASNSYDGALALPSPLPTGTWTMPPERQRGGFRYLTISSTSQEAVIVGNISAMITFMPHWEDLRAYTGYFYAPGEDLLTKAWYSGAYTVQTDTIPVNAGRQPSSPPGTWLNNATIGFHSPILVDGAKRDRTVWPGDMNIAVPTEFVSTFDLMPARNGLEILFSEMEPGTGRLPYSGKRPAINAGYVSDAYHAHTLIGVHTYWLYSGDLDWVQTVWANYSQAVGYLAGRVDESGLLDVLGTNDWGRVGATGHNAPANALYNRVLNTATELANALNETSVAAIWAQNATIHKQHFNDLLWDDAAGLYRDNETTTLHPEDGNSFAILYNLTLNDTQAQRISEGLTGNWNELGPVTPELADTIAPFVAGFELQAHFVANEDDRALELIRRTWGYMLTTNLSVQSTLLEGFTTNGSLLYRSADGYNFDAAYTSHAHGWSTGATSALTFYVLGLTVTSPQGKTWQVAPHPGQLNAVEGGFTTGLGWFGVKWSVTSGNHTITLNLDIPEGTSGTVIIPGTNGRILSMDGTEINRSNGIMENIPGGKHVVVGIMQ